LPHMEKGQSWRKKRGKKSYRGPLYSVHDSYGKRERTILSANVLPGSEEQTEEKKKTGRLSTASFKRGKKGRRAPTTGPSTLFGSYTDIYGKKKRTHDPPHSSRLLTERGEKGFRAENQEFRRKIVEFPFSTTLRGKRKKEGSTINL